ncbi:flagellar basal body P-ring formation chaperone FlgA [Vibrio rotiferianus]|uniref:flagellar basal body P-ring formation chaperone FlgA n=1 Tax=Vibrio rotiferianus TaxID=190895 RepID=UPI00390BCCD0
MFYRDDRKSNFRLTEENNRTRKRGKMMLPRLIFPTVLGLSITPNIAVGAPNEDIIRQHVSTQFEQEVTRYADNAGWGNYQLNYDLWVPKSVNHLPKCSQPLVISTRDHQSQPVGNLKRSVSCDDLTHNWRINVTIKSSVSLDVVVANNTINRGTLISAIDLKIERRTLSKQDGFFTEITKVSGNEAARRIRSGQLLSQSNVETPALIEKGNEIVLIATKDGFTATTKGIALETGYRGEQIEVQNKTSGKVVHAIVTGLNQAHTQF